MNVLPRVYCAGPLFNSSEREEMTSIANRLNAAGYPVYLPHRDGMEFRLVLDVLIARGYEKAVAGQFLHSAIFALDVYQLVFACDAIVWNLNGRVPDEGAVSEAAMAWILGKPMIAFSDDARSLIEGRINPLLFGLVDFQKVTLIEEIVPALQAALQNYRAAGWVPAAEKPLHHLPPRVSRAVSDGAALWSLLENKPIEVSQAQHHVPDEQPQFVVGAQPVSAVDEIDNERIADCVIKLFAPERLLPMTTS
ncbi:hypothetical protein Plim_1335 [Planctopirus limnophila DSM 3776]|uniref:Nucleoside 2-deoxyribosyltransferase n=2 Tax=Planctopirus limnophila TaxID=120 RepID=D5SV99_PLAL2|nr:hypothetical protein Plim_1335 [Planctopirus limnophila DSM 3776]